MFRTRFGPLAALALCAAAHAVHAALFVSPTSELLQKSYDVIIVGGKPFRPSSCLRLSWGTRGGAVAGGGRDESASLRFCFPARSPVCPSGKDPRRAN